MDTCTVDHLLSKLNSDSVKMSWLSPIDDVGLSNYQKYLKPPEKKNVICIPLFDRVHFQGYIINIKNIKQFTSIHFAGTNLKFNLYSSCKNAV